MKVTLKKNLEDQKLKFDGQWAAKLKKDGNTCKIMNSVDLIVSFISLYEIDFYFLETQAY